MDWLLSAISVLVLDQGTKALVLDRYGGVEPASGVPPRRRPLARPAAWRPRLHPIRNTLRNRRFTSSRAALLLLWATAVLGTIALLHRYPPLQGRVAHIGLGAALGGATGNLVDLLRHGAVIDFVDLRFWPVFNLADVAIVAGLATAVWAVVSRAA